MSDTAKVAIAIRVPSTTAEALRARAADAGVSPSMFASEILTAAVAPPAPTGAAHRWTADVQLGQRCAVCGVTKDVAPESCAGSRSRG